jgi:hypothetical protein
VRFVHIEATSQTAANTSQQAPMKCIAEEETDINDVQVDVP